MSEQVCYADGDPATARYMIVGEAPGKEEAAMGRGFVGPSGRLFWSVASEVGIDRASCFTTNVVQSWPALKSGKSSKAQIHAEWERLESELTLFQGPILICVGGVAQARITGLPGGIVANRGYVIKPSTCPQIERTRRVEVGTYKRDGKNGKAGDKKYAKRTVAEELTLPGALEYIMPVLHPAGIMRSKFAGLPALKADLRRVWRAAHGKLELIDQAPHYTTPQMPHAVDAVTIDIETSMSSGAIERVGMAWWAPMAQEIICWTAPWDDKSREVIRSVCGSDEIVKEFHNYAFDGPRLEAAGCPIKGKIRDTMYGAQILNPDLPKGLEKVAPLYCDVTPWKRSSESDPVGYNAKDAYVQCAVGRKMWPYMRQTRQERVFAAVNEGLPVLVNMERRGIRCHVERTQAWVTKQEERMTRAAMQWPWPDVNYGSPSQLAKLFYGKLQLPVQRSKHGGTTTDEAAIATLVRWMDAKADDRSEVRSGLRALLDLREISRNISYYGKVVLGEDSCVHPRYLPADREEAGAARGQGARTGRIQPRDPNLSNQHTDARRLYIPKPGWAFGIADWKQAEAWLECEASGDEALRTALEGDLHATLSERMGVDRIRAKNTWYGTRNLGGPRTLRQMALKQGYDIPESEWRACQAELFAAFPQWTAWRHQLIALCQTRHFVEEPVLGRRLYFYHRGLAPRIIGYYPQAGVGSMLWKILPEVEWECGGEFVTTRHDEVVMQAPANQIKGVMEQVHDVMCQEWPQVAPGFRLDVDVQLGHADESWGDVNRRCK